MAEGRRVSSARGFTRNFCGVFVSCGLVSLALQAAGCFTTGWMIMKVGEGKLYMGLWAVKTCMDDTCNTISTSDVDTMLGSVWSTSVEEYQVLTCLALGLMVASLTTTPVCAFCKNSRTSVKLGAWGIVIATLISGILAIAASAKFGNKVRQADELLRQLSWDSPMDPPYSVILTGVGGLLAFILSLATLVYLKPWRRELEPPPRMELRPAPAPTVVAVYKVYPPNHDTSSSPNLS